MSQVPVFRADPPSTLEDLMFKVQLYRGAIFIATIASTLYTLGAPRKWW